MRLIRTKSADAPFVWAKYQSKVDQRYRQLEQIRQRAINDEKLDIARRAIENMIRLDKELIDVGQALGVYQKAATKHEHSISAPTLGMFHDADKDLEDAEFEEVPPKQAIEHDGGK